MLLYENIFNTIPIFCKLNSIAFLEGADVTQNKHWQHNQDCQNKRFAYVDNYTDSSSVYKNALWRASGFWWAKVILPFSSEC